MIYGGRESGQGTFAILQGILRHDGMAFVHSFVRDRPFAVTDDSCSEKPRTPGNP